MSIDTPSEAAPNREVVVHFGAPNSASRCKKAWISDFGSKGTLDQDQVTCRRCGGQAMLARPAGAMAPPAPSPPPPVEVLPAEPVAVHADEVVQDLEQEAQEPREVEPFEDVQEPAPPVPLERKQRGRPRKERPAAPPAPKAPPKLTYKTITREQENELVLRYQAGDNRAGAALLDLHAALIQTWANHYAGMGVDLEDLRQEARIGFLKGAMRYGVNDKSGAKLASYAHYWMRQKTGRFLQDNATDIRIPVHNQGRKASEETRVLVAHIRNPVRLDASITDEDERTFGDVLPAEAAGPDLLVEHADSAEHQRRLVARAMASLSPREKEIIARRILAEEPELLDDVGASLGVSRERVRQLEKKALLKLKRVITKIKSEAPRRKTQGSPSPPPRPRPPLKALPIGEVGEEERVPRAAPARRPRAALPAPALTLALSAAPAPPALQIVGPMPPAAPPAPEEVAPPAVVPDPVAPEVVHVRRRRTFLGEKPEIEPPSPTLMKLQMGVKRTYPGARGLETMTTTSIFGLTYYLRSLLWMLYGDGMSINAVATKLNVSTSFVRKLEASALRQLGVTLP